MKNEMIIQEDESHAEEDGDTLLRRETSMVYASTLVQVGLVLLECI